MLGYTVTEISLVRDFQSFYYADVHCEYSREQYPVYSLLNRVNSELFGVSCEGSDLQDMS